MLRNVLTLLLPVLAVTGVSVDPRCTRYSLGSEAQVLPHLQDCRKFVICDMGGNGQVLSCPPGLFFSDEAHACSFDMAACTHGELDETVPFVPEPQPPRPVPQEPSLPVAPVEPRPLPLPPMGKIYPIANDCGLYVVCMGNNDAIVQRCPKGLLYDHQQQRCEFADASYCATPRVDGRLVLDIHGHAPALVMEMVQHEHQPVLFVPEPEIPEPVQPIVEYNFRIIDNHPRCLARSNMGLTAQLPHDSDCRKYLVCVGRVAIEKVCPAGQHWNAKNNWCDFASVAGCTLAASPCSSAARPGTPSGRRCPSYTSILVPLALATVLEAKVLATRDPRCPRVDNPERTVHLTHPTDCNRFLVCSSGMAYEMRCPDGLEYDVEQSSCDYDYLMPLEQLALNRPSWNDQQEEPRVDSPPQPVPQYKPAVSVVDARCPRTDDPMKPIHLPRTGNCGKFMKCFGGRAYEMDCPAGLEFDAKNGRCEYPALARCSRL
ncbi:AGAP012132-PA [Anopheles gambiae str. PEST]|uniref:AGAP012132-PA n=1 Tax=Anopheles gambiae TaxID=7165 RepID=Q5TN13_ANOGA|nr:AGAP012132-PA [Anopheles gambiae str. PEST]